MTIIIPNYVILDRFFHSFDKESFKKSLDKQIEFFTLRF